MQKLESTVAKIVSTADIDTNQQNGVVVLRNCINSDWISQLRVAVEEIWCLLDRVPKSKTNLGTPASF